MKCDECSFSIGVERYPESVLCLVNGVMYEKDRECHMPSTEEKYIKARTCKMVSVFERNRDVVLAALKMMRNHNFSAACALATVKVIYGRYIK